MIGICTRHPGRSDRARARALRTGIYRNHAARTPDSLRCASTSGMTGEYADACSSSHGRCGEAGFSLIEMLVAISILALVLAMLPGTFSLAHRTWDATAVLDQRARQDGGRSFLQTRLAEAMPIFEPVGAGAVQLVFTGSAEMLTFVAPSANGPQGAGLYRFTLETKPQGSAGSALVVTVAPFVLKRGRNDDATLTEEHVLYEGITSASFRYYGRKDLASSTPSWQTAWTRRDALPNAVELTVASGKTTRTSLIELRLKNGP